MTAAAIRKVELYGKWIGTRRPQGDGAERRSEAYLEYKKANRACIKATRLAKSQQLEQKAKELEQSARCNNTRRVFQMVNEIEGSARATMDLLRALLGI